MHNDKEERTLRLALASYLFVFGGKAGGPRRCAELRGRPARRRLAEELVSLQVAHCG